MKGCKPLDESNCTIMPVYSWSQILSNVGVGRLACIFYTLDLPIKETSPKY